MAHTLRWFLLLCFTRCFSDYGFPTTVADLSYDKGCRISDSDACGPSGVCECYFAENVSFINCTGKSLTRIPRNIPLNATAIKFDYNQLECIPTNYMLRFDKLIRFTTIENLLKRSFLLPSRLYLFDVTGNKLEDIDYFFIDCRTLSKVDLAENRIKQIPDWVFRNCSRMTDLSFHDNLIEVIGNRNLAGLSSLRLLRLHGLKQLRKIEQLAFRDLFNLETLIIYSCHKLDNIPTGLFTNCKKLNKLTLRDNHITRFQDGVFTGLQNLIQLSFGANVFLHNGISGGTLAGIHSISNLLVYKANIDALPEDLFSTVQLNGTVDFGGNKLRSLPAKLFSYRIYKIKALYLYHNLLQSIPSGIFCNLEYLENIYLFGNKITRLPESMMLGTSVTNIFLFQNNIDQISGAPFFTGRNDSEVKLVHLQGNPLRTVEPSAISGISESGLIILYCDFITIPWTARAVNISCVGNTYTPVIEFDDYAARSLRRSGFHCSSISQSSNCTACAVGTYGSEKADGCLGCPRGGFYQNEVGQSATDGGIACKKCNNGTFVMNGEGTSPLSCEVCPDGTDKSKPAEYRACFCLENYYRTYRFGQCYLCQREGMKCSGEYASIGYGYYWNWSYTDVNKYIDFVNNLKCPTNEYRNDTLYFADPLPMVHNCPQAFKCDNKENDIEGNCAKGYKGWLCSSCDDNYYAALGYCHECPPLYIFLLEMTILLIVIVTFLSYIIYQLRRENSRVIRSIADISIARGKIILAFYQIMGEFWDSLDVMNWPIYFQWVATVMVYLQFDVSFIFVKPSCYVNISVTPYEEFVIGISFPLLLISTTKILFMGMTCWLRACKDPEEVERREKKSKQYKEKIMMLVLSMLFVTYTYTCNVIFALYGQTCEKFYLDEDQLQFVSLMRSDYSIECKTKLHAKYTTAAYIATIYVVLFPGYLFIQLWRYSTKDCDHSSSVQDGTCRRKKYPPWLYFLCENYKPAFWYWEIVELGRKVLQTIVVILYGYDSSLSILVSVTIAVIFLSLNAAYAPMKDHFEHRLQQASLWAIFLNMLVAAVPIPADQDSAALITGGLLCVINLGVLLIIIGKIISQIILQIKSFTHKCKTREDMELRQPLIMEARRT
ncbi:uncharacterized protein [Apostichopus japonicus]|uniref:uncharacterized protein isoform X3 n=1 Tax=Stichopus japonicus TaxID=307972 RepID=UPI003AB6B1C0